MHNVRIWHAPKPPDLSVHEGRFVLILTDESWPIEGFIPAETLVQNGTAGDNATAGGTLNHPVLGFLVG